jgi:predicted RNA-binding Zn-ribbon protein involved in translation (DUF1610 family)
MKCVSCGKDLDPNTREGIVLCEQCTDTHIYYYNLCGWGGY